MLQIKDIDVYYGSIHALKKLSLEVEKGSIVTLIGANGAGKTTTLNTISGILRPRNGTIIYKGIDIARWPQKRWQDWGSPRYLKDDVFSNHDSGGEP